MRETGITARPEDLLGREPSKDSPFGELLVDDEGRPVAVVCYALRNTLPEIPGLTATREDGGWKTEKVTYTREGE